MRKLLLVYALSCLSLCLKSQSGNSFFYHIYADHGLSSDKTTVAVEDYLGFVWLGTEEGLNKIKGGNNFEIFKYNRSDSSTISNNHVTVLFEDSQQRLWVGTKNGLNLFNRNTNTFKRVEVIDKAKSVSGVKIFDLNEDKEGNLWVSVNHQLVKIDGTTQKRLLSLDLRGSNGEFLEPSRVGLFSSNIWVGSSDGLYKLSGKQLVKSGIAAGESITDFLKVGNELWISTEANGILRYNTEDKDIADYEIKESLKLTHNSINDLCLVNNEVWIATNSGVDVYNLDTYEISHYGHNFDNGLSLSDEVIRNIYVDKSNVVWLTTPNSGINYYHKADNLFKYYGQSKEEGTEKDLMDNAVFSIFSGRDGGVWLGSRKGMSRLDPFTNKFEHFSLTSTVKKEVNSVLSIAQCSANYLWLGTNNGLVKWTNENRVFKYIMPEELNGYVVKTVMADEYDNLWLGTESHGVKLYASVNKILRDIDFEIEGAKLEHFPTVNSIKKIDNGILVGTEKGLFKFSEGLLRRVSLKDFQGLPDEIPINEIYQDSKQQVWIGTEQDGVLVLNDQLEIIEVYDKESGIQANDIRSIVEDKPGVMWLSTNNGVSKLQIETDSLAKVSVKNYSIVDGLQGNQFSARAAAKSNDDRILFGGLSGLTVFDPDQILDFKVEQSPVFLGLTVNGEVIKAGVEGSPLSKDISLTERLVLNCEQNNFTIQFDALDNVRPNAVVYRYKLVNYDDDWIEKKVGQASYKDIPAGKDYDFVFQSKGALSADWSEEKILSIRVEPHFYQTVWFKTLIVILVIGLIGLILWIKEKRTLSKHQELEGLVNERSSELHKEIGERKRVEDKLRTALEEAEDANQIKNKFLSNMSHEIRTPLNGIMGLTQLSLEADLDKEQEDILRTISNSADSLKAIVDDILDIAKIESGSLEMIIEPFNIKDLLKEIVSSFSFSAEEKNINLKHWVLPDVPDYIEGDVKHIRQVLVNLISNAVKFTHVGGVTIFAEALIEEKGDNIEVWFTVTDTGIGIAESHQEKIFESFNQVDIGSTREYGGTGLGLSISKELVTKMGGELWVESEENKGSIFKFYIKAKISDVADLKTLNEEGKTALGSPALGRVLLVEDNPTNQKVASKMLKNKGLNVTCAENGQVALDQLKAEDFDVVLMDLQMPVMDGYEATRHIRNIDGAKSQIPIIALTAAVMTGEKDKCFAAGMNDYLTKPVSYNLLIETVNSYLEPDQELELSE